MSDAGQYYRYPFNGHGMILFSESFLLLQKPSLKNTRAYMHYSTKTYSHLLTRRQCLARSRIAGEISDWKERVKEG